MITIPSLRPETQYGIPDTGWIRFYPGFVASYSGVLKSARWVLERMDDRECKIVERQDDFRIDPTIPDIFRADLADYKGSGYDRGHLVASANARETELENSGTFLMSNMSPQDKNLNRHAWKDLEGAARELATYRRQVFVICGPLFEEDKLVETIGKNKVPVPHAYFKSILSEGERGKLEIHTFRMPNGDTRSKPFWSYLVPTRSVERSVGFLLWDRLESDERIARRKEKAADLWDIDEEKKRLKRRKREEREAKKKKANQEQENDKARASASKKAKPTKKKRKKTKKKGKKKTTRKSR